MKFQAPESLAEQIAQHLGRLIITGELRANERIQELKVAGDLEVSRGSVREALLILERRHLIEIYPRRGAVVSDLTVNQVESLYDVYASLLVMLARKVAESWRESDLAPVMNQVQQINRAVMNEEASFESVIDSGFSVMSYCLTLVSNPYLEEILENLRPAISRTYHLAIRRKKGELYQSMNFYNGLLQAVQQRDFAGVKLVIESFAEHQKNLVISILQESS
ncbi:MULTISPECIES: GntR family transcriptional regulator [Hahella]|uniref:Transcriptional regulator n=1 Tax=Hahella chejuensis (strain KCTC 2396) TaxID=349521 RepID=Q2SD43_HAHCH|nr:MULTISPECIES: GntR family transcriptional regulator [Hahella]ABC31431.1 Transcriptional regulator [Hahella chejuensis KCTC 2396]MBU6952939.1 GntR family transcriptional regulator [Hahella sp. HN01]MDG9667644.1 GntR family transcriptional regulator [Hahella sp. CR1]WLQ15102.1 GntR family transcriptional regulator [Hahella sp. HNIBRBA332]